VPYYDAYFQLNATTDGLLERPRPFPSHTKSLDVDIKFDKNVEISEFVNSGDKYWDSDGKEKTMITPGGGYIPLGNRSVIFERSKDKMFRFKQGDT
jgi:hypothetical protein